MAEHVHVWVQRFKDRATLQLQWIDPLTGRRHTKTSGTADPAAAERRRVALEYELSHGVYAEPSKLTWQTFRRQFEAEHAAGLRPGSRQNLKTVLDQLEAFCAPRTLAGVTERTLSQFAARLRQEPGRQGVPMQPRTIRSKLGFLRSVLGWARKQKLVAAVPDFPAVRVPRKRPAPVPAGAVERLLARAAAEDAGLHALLLCGWLAGLRLAEACNLSWLPTTRAAWVDLDAGRVVFPAEAVKAAEDQWVPLDRELRAALLALPRPRSGRVFDFGVLPGGVCGRVRRLAARAGVALSMRQLRRGFGSRYAAKVPAQVLQRLMRHANIRMTVEYYTNVDEAAMEAVLGPGRDGQCNAAAKIPA